MSIALHQKIQAKNLVKLVKKKKKSTTKNVFVDISEWAVCYCI